MGYKQNLKYTVADLMNSWTAKRKVSGDKIHPAFVILDSPKQRHFSVLMGQPRIGHFLRKAGEYGLVTSKAMCMEVGNTSEISVFHVHIVEESDCST